MSSATATDVLVTTDWVLANLETPGVKLVEIDVDTKAYDAGHIPGSVGFDWRTELQDQVSRDILSKAGFEALMSAAGVTADDTVILYGDNNNWFAAYGFWLFKIYGHKDVRLMDGGRAKWLDEDDKPLTNDATTVSAASYVAQEPDPALRANVGDVLKTIGSDATSLIDVRSPDEFTGAVIAPPGMSETAQRGGHVPGAKSVPWATAVADNGTFRPVDELESIYLQGAGVARSKPTIAYCRIGERSSHTWFVLKYLLGVEDVRNYDGSWTEYGSMVGVPIEK